MPKKRATGSIEPFVNLNPLEKSKLYFWRSFLYVISWIAGPAAEMRFSSQTEERFEFSNLSRTQSTRHSVFEVSSC